jgi:hypothetical protein
MDLLSYAQSRFTAHTYITPSPQKGQKKLPAIFFYVFFWTPVVSATNQGSRKNHKKNSWKFFSGLFGERD